MLPLLSGLIVAQGGAAFGGPVIKRNQEIKANGNGQHNVTDTPATSELAPSWSRKHAKPSCPTITGSISACKKGPGLTLVVPGPWKPGY